MLLNLPSSPPSPLLMLAPMEGLTNGGIRQLILDIGGVDTVATEFIRITSPNQRIKPIHRHDTGLLQIQFMASEPETLARLIRMLRKRGVITSRDWIDINVGCPSRKVNAHGAGAALLKEPDKLSRMVCETRAAHPDGRLSMKTRIGYDSSSDFSMLLKTFSQLPLDLLTIHARTKKGSYDPEALQLRPLHQAATTLPYPVVGNGDIFSVEEAIRMLDTGVAGIMCGRGVMVNPFLFRDLREFLNSGELSIQEDERVSLLSAFALDYLSYLKEQETKTKTGSKVGAFKEFSTWFSRNSLIGRQFFDAIKRLSSLADIETSVHSYFSELTLKKPGKTQGFRCVIHSTSV